MNTPRPIHALCRHAMGIAVSLFLGAAPGVSAAFDAKRYLFLDPAIFALTDGARNRSPVY
jgi:hypothetical protein